MARWLILSRRYLRASAREVKYLVPIVSIDRLDGEFDSVGIQGAVGMLIVHVEVVPVLVVPVPLVGAVQILS